MKESANRIKNDRLYLAVKKLIEGEGNVKARVVSACQILHRMSRNEISMDLRIRLDDVLAEASKKPALLTANNEVLAGRDKYVQTAINRRNSTYVKLAKEIYAIYWEDLNS